MRTFEKIISVGISPCWDCTYEVAGIDFGDHKTVDSALLVPAGKAFNINKALAWLGVESMAAGFWGSVDYENMLAAVERYGRFVNVSFTKIPGSTRINTSIVDTKNNRQIHLRQKSNLASVNSLARLKGDIGKIVDEKNLCVFAGALPSDLTAEVLGVIAATKNAGAKIAVDSSGPAFKKIVNGGLVNIIKPNFEELCELLGKDINDDVSSIADAVRPLLEKCDVVIVSRGSAGALVISNDGVISGQYAGPKFEASNTVACGDFLLAGFLAGLKNKNDLSVALEMGLKTATAKAMGLSDKNWAEIENEIEIKVG